MTRPIPESKLLHVTDRKKWRAWLKKNYKSKDEIWLVYAKKHTGEPRISYNDAVEEALCFGWIDSIVKTIDDHRFTQRFSVRKSKSSYSQPNRERLRALVVQGKVMPDVLESLPDLSEDDFKIAPDILEAIKANKQAWKNFQGFSDPYIRIRVSYIEAGRERSEIFEKRLANFISKTEKNKIFGYGGIEKYY
ncbi:MAG: YdeI family protein [Anaerolineales bacterium]